MIIYAYKEGAWLNLNAYTEDVSEFNEVFKSLNEADIEFSLENLPPKTTDTSGMTGKNIRVYDSSVGKLEKLLQMTISYEPDGSNKLKFAVLSGTSFKCERISGLGCETFKADCQGAATIQCGDIAKTNGWARGGKASPGQC